MTFFDTDGDGHVNFDEFLIGIRVSPILSKYRLGQNEPQETSYDW